MRVLAIDLGSSYIKSACLNLETQQIEDPQREPVRGRIARESELLHEVVAAVLWHAVQRIVEARLTAHPDMEGIVFSTQMHGFILADLQWGEDAYVSWQDARCLRPMPGRSESYLAHLQGMLTPERMRATGVYVKPALGMCNLYAMLSERGFAVSPGATLYTLGSYCIEKLTGNNVCHVTNAAALGLVDIARHCWHTGLIDQLGFSALRFPTLTHTLEACGYLTWQGRRIPVYPDIGDTQCAVLGSGADEQELIVNMGTAGQVMRIQPHMDIGNADPSYYEVRPFFENRYCHVISRMPGGRNLDVLVDFFREIGQRMFGLALDREAVWERMAGVSEPTGEPRLAVDIGFYELPQRMAGGAITGIDRANLTVDHLLSAAYRNIGEIYRDYGRALQPSGAAATRLRFSGGAIRNNVALQASIQRVCGLPGEPSPIQDEVFAGLLRIAGWSAARETQKRGTHAEGF